MSDFSVHDSCINHLWFSCVLTGSFWGFVPCDGFVFSIQDDCLVGLSSLHHLCAPTLRSSPMWCTKLCGGHFTAAARGWGWGHGLWQQRAPTFTLWRPYSDLWITSIADIPRPRRSKFFCQSARCLHVALLTFWSIIKCTLIRNVIQAIGAHLCTLRPGMDYKLSTILFLHFQIPMKRNLKRTRYYKSFVNREHGLRSRSGKRSSKWNDSACQIVIFIKLCGSLKLYETHILWSYCAKSHISEKECVFFLSVKRTRCWLITWTSNGFPNQQTLDVDSFFCSLFFIKK